MPRAARARARAGGVASQVESATFQAETPGESASALRET
jgi:hypothetical protein